MKNYLHFSRKISFLMFFMIVPFLTNAQWNVNTLGNLLISDLQVASLQTAETHDGKLWVSYYHESGSNYNMMAQLFDADGKKLLGDNGVLVNNNPSGTAIFVYNVAADADGNFIIGMQDQRDGGQKAVLYKIGQDGNHLWSQEGVQLGEGLAPWPEVLSNGDVVVSWESFSIGTISMHKLSADADFLWAEPISLRVESSNTTRAQIVANLDGKFTVVYQRRSFGISTTLYAQQFANDGTPAFNPLQLGEYTTSGARYYSVQADADTTYVGYYAAAGNRFNSYLQRINPDGTTPYGMNGANFNTETEPLDNYQQFTSIKLDHESDYVWSVCGFSDPNQDNYGLYVQKFNKLTGARQLTDLGKEIYPITSKRDTPAGSLLLNDDAPLIMSYDIDYKIYVTRLDKNGDFAWEYERMEISSTTASLASGKGRFAFNHVGPNWVAGIWTEKRGAITNGFIQGVSVNGLISIEVETDGGVPAEISENGGTLQLMSTIYPSVANQMVEWSADGYESLVVVDDNGLVTAVGNGTAWVKATAVQDNNLADSVMITTGCQVTQPIGPIAGTENVCNNATGIIFSVPVFEGATSYVWSVPAGFIITSGDDTNEITVDFSAEAVSGDITVYVLFGTDCMTDPSDEFAVTVSEIPDAAVISQEGDVLTSSATEGNQWYLDGVAIDGATGNQHVAVAEGDYYVVVTVGNCSSEPSNTINVVPVNVSEVFSAGSFDVYPNPNQGRFDVKMPFKTGELVSIMIYDVKGQLIFHEHHFTVSEKQTSKIDMQTVPDGLYMMVLKGESKSWSGKFVVSNP